MILTMDSVAYDYYDMKLPKSFQDFVQNIREKFY